MQLLMRRNIFSEIYSLLPAIKKVNESTFELLGSPIFKLGLERMFSAKAVSIMLICSRLKLMDVPILR